MVEQKTTKEITEMELKLLDKGLNIKNSKKFRELDNKVWVKKDEIIRVLNDFDNDIRRELVNACYGMKSKEISKIVKGINYQFDNLFKKLGVCEEEKK